jgi:uncharacterized protein YfaS (alpha-2-macroglobulin family)
MKLLPLLVATSLVSATFGYMAGRLRQPASPVTVSRSAPATPPAPAPSGIGIVPAPVQPVAEQAKPPSPPSGVRALDLLRIALDSKGTKAEACLVFSGAISVAPDFHPADFLLITPAVRPAVQVSGDHLCLAGLAFGTSYTMTVRAGLPGADGARTLADETLPLSLGDLPGHAEFADDGFILGRDSVQGLPIATVNVPKVHLRVERITDRVLVRTHLGEGYEPDPETLGVPLWEGDLLVKSARNAKAVTAFPLASILPKRLPGAYRITLINKPDSRGGDEEYEPQVERWIFNTDLMLTTHRGEDGLHVFVRSLATARPDAGADVSLLAANNDELGRVRTDANGEAVFAAGLLRGTQGLAPRMVMAYAGDDFTALDLDKPGFDLSDRGVEGRAEPGPVDGYLYTDRGIYRPGETIQLGTIVRSQMAQPLPDGQVVAIILHRPDGVEAGRWRLVPNAVGIGVQAIPLNITAPRGTWHIEETLAGTKAPIGALDVQVQDFVPNRLAVELTPRTPRITGAAPAIIDVASRYLYGAPAANLDVSAHVQLQRDDHPVAAPGWRFGREEERLNAESQDIAGPKTDAEGHASVTLNASDLKIPQTSLPLRADVTVAVAEPGGRATEATTTLKVATHDVLIGLRPANEAGELQQGQASSVAVAAFSPEGTHLARRLAFRLVEQVTEFNYFAIGNQWRWKLSTHDRPVTFGTIDVPADEHGATVTLPPLSWGTFRLDVTDAQSSAMSSAILHAGFAGSDADEAQSPEKVSVSLQGPAPRPGELVKLHVKPPFAGKLLVTVENSRVLAVQTADIPADGADITVKADASWGVGAYVMASVYRPSTEAAGHAPIRAVGLAYVKLDLASRTLAVSLATPPVLRPRTHLDVGVTVTGEAASQGRVWLTLAAVDEGILQLTRFASPDPVSHFFGKRRLAVDVRDDYAHLIDGNGGAPGEIRAGGDLDGAGLSVVPTRTTALFSGLVEIGADGHAVVPLDLPDFTGGLRLMAVAVNEAGFGHADAQVPVRDPVVAQVSLPRFLAPADRARLTLLMHDVEAPPGTFHVHIAAEGALAMPTVDEDFPMSTSQQMVRTYPLNGGSVGIGRVTLLLTGPGGMRIAHDWPMEVRTPYQSITRVTRADQPPGESVTLTKSLAEGLVPQGATVRAGFSSVGNIDLPGLLDALDEYPFGCSEQLVSRAMPLLYVERESRLVGAVAPADLRLRVQDAVDKLLERQDESGAFGLWRAGDGQAEPFLGAMIDDFLIRAQRYGYAVPKHALSAASQALASLEQGHYNMHRFWFVNIVNGQDYVDYQYQAAVERAGRAYAYLLAARSGQADAADLRYMHDTELAQMEPLGQAQLAVGLALLGDRPRALHAFDTAEAGLAHERDDFRWRLGDFYRTRLRDTAAMLSLAAEIGDRPRVNRLLTALDRFDIRTQDLTTQQQGWLVIAAGVLLEKSGPVTVTANGKPQPPAAVVNLQKPLEDLGELTVRNDGTGSITRMVSVRGLPVDAPPASASHMSIAKQITNTDGSPADLAHLHQNQRLVIHLFGSTDDRAYHQSMLVDPLPAGFEIERVVAPSTETEANGLPWLGDITRTRTAEKRDDRFMAAIDLGGRPDFDGGEMHKPTSGFNIAYVVRVVSPGHFVLPAASIRDMYRPDVQARGAVGAIDVEAPN